MSDAIKRMRDFLAISPSVVYPDEVLELLEPIEAENAKLRKFATASWQMVTHNDPRWTWKGMEKEARELGIEV